MTMPSPRSPHVEIDEHHEHQRQPQPVALGAISGIFLLVTDLGAHQRDQAEEASGPGPIQRCRRAHDAKTE
jgi:hypothetical protein